MHVTREDLKGSKFDIEEYYGNLISHFSLGW